MTINPVSSYSPQPIAPLSSKTATTSSSETSFASELQQAGVSTAPHHHHGLHGSGKKNIDSDSLLNSINPVMQNANASQMTDLLDPA